MGADKAEIRRVINTCMRLGYSSWQRWENRTLTVDRIDHNHYPLWSIRQPLPKMPGDGTRMARLADWHGSSTAWFWSDVYPPNPLIRSIPAQVRPAVPAGFGADGPVYNGRSYDRELGFDLLPTYGDGMLRCPAGQAVRVSIPLPAAGRRTRLRCSLLAEGRRRRARKRCPVCPGVETGGRLFDTIFAG